MTETILLSIPVLADEGPNSRLSRHYGRAPLHLLVFSDGRSVAALPGNPEEGGKALPAEEMFAAKVAAVLAPEIGRGAYGKLSRAGIAVFSCPCVTVREALEAFAQGRLAPVSEEELAAHDKDRAEGRRGLRGSGECHRGENGGCHREGQGEGRTRCCERGGARHGASCGHGCGRNS